MTSKKCCVPGCAPSGRSHKVLHGFPNPVDEESRFQLWLSAIGGEILELQKEHVYKNRRICHLHFDEKFCCRKNRISNIAVPTVHMPGHVVHAADQVIESPVIKPTTNMDIDDTIHLSTASQSGISDRKPLQELQNVTKTSLSTYTVSGVLEIPYVYARPLTEFQKVSSTPSASTGVITQSNKPSSKNKTMLKKTSKKIKMASKEEILYKKLAAMRLKLSRCKNRAQKHFLALKAAQKITSNANLIKVTENLTSTAKILTMLQFRESKKKSKGRRFQLKEKVIALSIFKQSPKAYRFLRKIFVLPAPQVLAKLISDAMLTPGINKNVYAQLKNKATKMEAIEKLCTVLFDEISIKPGIYYNEKKDKITGFVTDSSSTTQRELADHCLVFMIKGLIKNYKQPVAYSFCSGSTKTHSLVKQIKEVLNNLLDAGLIPLATVCDQGASNQSAIKYLIQDSKRDFLIRGEGFNKNVFYVNGQEIVPVYDPPHLLKGIRNNLLTKDLKYVMDGKSGTAKWAHLELLYNENPGYKGIRLIPKLTENHVVPEKIGKMKVKYASQTFSATVSANMGYLADKGILPEETKETADILRFFDELFDSVNGSFKKKIFSKPLLGPVKPYSVHHQKWKGSIKVLKSMTFVGRTAQKDIPSLQN